ncbi:MAG: 50S ribosomal protein L10 [SAR202 cluster bacterium]|nr:50S ribosomal protein L10 [SAR202 cluster bacterium]MQG52086.1 50S ribosomal protein L10 [SAR202 cluster bacterium]
MLSEVKLPTERKINQVESIKEKLQNCTIAVTADYSNIDVNAMTDLRKSMRSEGIEFLIVKKTLLELAADSAGKSNVHEIIQGPTGVAFGYDDPTIVAKALASYVERTGSPLNIYGAVVGDTETYTKKDVESMAKLPPKPDLIAKIMGQLQSPLYQLAGALNSPLYSLGGILQSRISQMENSGSA